ncbi:hypothetical protein HZA71_02805 [Candidatus Falkowbacteria bacterium]|nr:hypothetical protein [Candidatus Falkowbacteria bacterium]
MDKLFSILFKTVVEPPISYPPTGRYFQKIAYLKLFFVFLKSLPSVDQAHKVVYNKYIMVKGGDKWGNGQLLNG